MPTRSKKIQDPTSDIKHPKNVDSKCDQMVLLVLLVPLVPLVPLVLLVEATNLLF